MDPISTVHAPAPAGHYSQAIVHAGIVYVAGQLPIDPAGGTVVAPGDTEVQTERTLDNVAAILDAAGSGLDRVLSLTIHVTGREHWEAVNRVCARRFGSHRPARAIVPVPELKPGCAVEIQCTAAVG